MVKLVSFIILIIFSSSCESKIQEDRQITPSKKQQLKELSRTSPFTFETYCNSRFKYCIEYPVFLLFPGPESENGDGRIFTDSEGEEILWVYALPSYVNGKPITLPQQFSHDITRLENENVSGELIIKEKKSSSHEYIISGETTHSIFFQKAIAKDITFAYMILQYRTTNKQLYEKLQGKILSSFK